MYKMKEEILSALTVDLGDGFDIFQLDYFSLKVLA